MPTFATPEPISATVEVVSGAVHVSASDRDDTVVEVAPRDPGRPSDVRVAEQLSGGLRPVVEDEN
jgi:hypothetical protein